MEDLCLFLALEILNVYNIYKKKLFRIRSFAKAFGKWENPVCMFLLAVVRRIFNVYYFITDSFYILWY